MDEAKLAAANDLIEHDGSSVRAAAKEVGVAESTLRLWRKKTGEVSREAAFQDEFVEIPVIHRDYSDRKVHNVYGLGDVHKGAPAHDSERWLEWIEHIEHRADASLLGTGDYLNSALKTSVSDVYEETQTVGVAKRELIAELKPIKNKIDLLMPGNHEARIWKAIGDCPIEDAADVLGVPYARTAALVVYQVGDVEYEIYVRHGTGGGQVGARAARLQRQAQTCWADVYLSGHTHSKLAFPEEILKYNPETKALERRQRYFVSSGSFLRLEPYAVTAGYAPTSIGAPRIRLDGERRDVHVSI